MIHIISAVHNRYAITYNFIQQLKHQSYTNNIHLILVDDGSTDGTSAMVMSEIDDAMQKNISCTIIHGDGNLWWGGALHEAYRWVCHNLSNQVDEFLMISNDDVVWSDDYLENAINVLEEYRKKYKNKAQGVLLSGKGFSLNSGEWIDKVYCHDYSDKHGESSYVSETGVGDCCSTRSLFMTVRDMITIGGFHPILLPHYGSDYEWTMRAARKGYVICSDNRVTYEFDEGTTGDNFYDLLTLKKVFSKRSNTNPIYKLTSIVLTTPPKFICRELRKQFGRYWKHLRTFIGK